MDILIQDKWLRDYLKSSATPNNLAKHLSLSGPSVEKVINSPQGKVYAIEITGNRIDTAGVIGIAREAAAILPRFDIKATLTPPKPKAKQPLAKSVNYLKAKVDHSICLRFTAILLRDVKIAPSPSWLQDRLAAVGIRPINNIVDISNYLMLDLGQPTHTFDYDKIAGSQMILRKSKSGESITTLDNKTHKLGSDDIVIEDGEGKIIDLAGIMGGKLSEVDNKTKNVLLFVQNYNPVNIRKTSMRLAHRTQAAQMFEKGLDPEQVETVTRAGIDMFTDLCKAKPEDKILDLYPHPYKTKTIALDLDFINQRLGTVLMPSQIQQALKPLGFLLKANSKQISVQIPSFRANDINIPEDIVEEIARIYGYYRLPSCLMEGKLPPHTPNNTFQFEDKIKTLLAGWGGTEIYTYSLVPEPYTDNKKALKLKNPLGKDSEFLRNNLIHSLIQAANNNSHTISPFHLYEIANTYRPRSNNLPEEKMTLSGIFSNYDYRQAKGVVEALLAELNICPTFHPEDSKHFLPSQRVQIKAKSKVLGQFGTLEQGNYHLYELDLTSLQRASTSYKSFQKVPKYPAQIEDITLIIPERTRVGELLGFILKQNYISHAQLTDVYNTSYTFRVWYQHPTKTLDNKEVEKIRSSLLKKLESKFGANIS